MTVLLAAHALSGVLSAGLARVQVFLPYGLDEMPVVPLVALAGCEAFLLGFIAALAAGCGTGLGCLVVGCGYLGCLLIGGLGSDALPFGLLPTLIWLESFAVCRALGGLFVLRHFPTPPGDRARRRLAIRDLMGLTLTVALVLGMFQQLQGIVQTPSVLLHVTLWSVCSSVVGFSAVWATLSLARPLPRCLVAVLLATILGCLYFGSFLVWTGIVYGSAIFGLQALASVASLLVVRSCGYRLVRREGRPVGPRDGEQL